MIFLAIALVLLTADLESEQWRPFKDPGDTFSVEVPSSWAEGKGTEMPFSYIVSFRSSKAEAELTMSVTPNLQLPEQLPLEMIRSFFPPNCNVSEATRMKGDSWNGVRQDCTLSSGANVSKTWLGAFYGAGSSMVAITLSDSSEAIGAQRAVFERLIRSVQFNPKKNLKPPGMTMQREVGGGPSIGRTSACTRRAGTAGVRVMPAFGLIPCG